MAAREPLSATRSAIFDDRYEILSTVGRGRNSVVYKARLVTPHSGSGADLSTEAIVALKVLTASNRAPEANHDRMRREALAMLSARHPNVIQLHDYVAGEELCYLSMEYADMGDLRHELEQSEHPLDYEVVLHLMHQLLRGLDAIHRGGILHRDIKPENLLLTSRGMLKITDFGIALLPTESEPFEEVNRGIGTLEYLAPEYLESGISVPATDIYSVGVTAYQLLTKYLPFEGETVAAQLENKMAGHRVSLEAYSNEVPEHLDALIGKALETDYTKRFQSADAFGIAIERFLEGSWTPDHRETRSTAESLHQARRPETAKKPSSDGSGTSNEDEVAAILDKAAGLAPTAETDALTSVEPKLEPDKFEPIRRPSGAQRLKSRLGEILGRRGIAKTGTQNKRFPLSRGTLLAFSTLAICIFVGLKTMTSDGGADAAIRQTEAGAVASPAIIVRAQAGVMYDLLGKGSETPLAVAFVDSSQGDKAVISIGVSGWVPPQIELSSWESGETVAVASGGLKFSLWQDKINKVPNSLANGYYHEKATGRRGRWVIWQ
ncbi:MAG: serine/threonine protein kinase [Bdellovibrionales bacterium]|nr:serine/threonine protein kinase [Bdellovibrionales bacterium]